MNSISEKRKEDYYEKNLFGLVVFIMRMTSMPGITMAANDIIDFDGRRYQR